MRMVGLVVAAVLGSVGPAAALSVEKLLGQGRLVAYEPRAAATDPTGRPSARALRDDAESLLALGFRAVTTHGTSRATAPVCRFFKRRGFRTVLVGIADPNDPAELRRAVRLKRCADGFVVGSEGLGAGRYARADLDRAIRRVRAASGRPVTTREGVQAFRDDPALARLGDWLFPTIQPWHAGKRDPQDACGWTIFTYRDLAERAPVGMPTVIAATTFPTEGELGASDHYQRAFLLCLESRHVPFAWATAFDEPASADVVRAHGGLFRADGSPKLWAAQQLKPALVVERAGDSVRGRLTDAPRGLVQVVAYVKTVQWELAPAIVLDRRGEWTLAVPRGRPVAVYVASRAWSPPPAVDRRPRLDRTYVLAERELPAL